MVKTLSGQFTEIKRESKQMAAALAKEVAEVARRDLAKAQEKIIDNYYQDYSPQNIVEKVDYIRLY